MTPENAVEMIRKVLETHGSPADQHDLVQKCSGCPWIGWDHRQHVAEAVLATVASEIINTIGEALT